jgi:hypothetical protein
MELSPPIVKPQSQPKYRMVTPYNRLVGAFVVTQKRRQQENCASNNPFVTAFTDFAGVTCPADALDNQPFGYDPAFMSFSSIYNGKLKPQDYYYDEECWAENITAQDGTSQLFMPHS